MANPVSKKPGNFRDVGNAEATIATALLVKAGSAADGVALCGAGNTPLGVVTDVPNPSSTNFPSATSGDQVEYAPPGAEGWFEFTASEAIAAGAEFIAAASGMIGAVDGTSPVIGILHQNSRAATQSGDKVVGRLYATPDSGYADGDAVMLWANNVPEPGASENGKVLSWNNGTGAYEWIAN